MALYTPYTQSCLRCAAYPVPYSKQTLQPRILKASWRGRQRCSRLQYSIMVASVMGLGKRMWSKAGTVRRNNLASKAQEDDAIDYKSSNFIVTAVGKKGLGVVATAPIKQGDLLLEEAPLLTFQNQSFQVLLGDLQEVLFDRASFDHWEQSLTETLQSNCSEEVRSKFWDLADVCCKSDKTALGIARTNAIGLSDDSAGLFLLLSRFNHSCNPNVYNTWQEDTGVQVLRATRDIAEGEELCISYLSFLQLCAPRHERLGELSDRFGFDCLCGVCSRPPSESDWRRERLSQLCDAFARDEQYNSGDDSNIIWLHLRKRMPLFFEVEEEQMSKIMAESSQMRGTREDDLDDTIESINMRDGLRETTDLIEEEFSGNPAALSLVFFGAYRKASSVGRVSAAKSLAKAALKAIVSAEGSNSWRAKQLETVASKVPKEVGSQVVQESWKKNAFVRFVRSFQLKASAWCLLKRRCYGVKSMSYVPLDIFVSFTLRVAQLTRGCNVYWLQTQATHNRIGKGVKSELWW